MSNWKPGDVVQLKSGGPAMTVAAVGVGLMGDRVACDWFEGKKKHQEQFAPESLQVPQQPPLPSRG